MVILPVKKLPIRFIPSLSLNNAVVKPRKWLDSKGFFLVLLV